VKNQKFHACLFFAIFLAVVLISTTQGHATVYISNDRGGRIGTYVDTYNQVRDLNDTVVIDGLCASACTLILGSVPYDKICVTSKANLGFHAAWDYGPNGRHITNREATQQLYNTYPRPVQKWITQRGGLTPHMVFLHGKQLMHMYRPCPLDAQAKF
jgi:hypothetical protein